MGIAQQNLKISKSARNDIVLELAHHCQQHNLSVVSSKKLKMNFRSPKWALVSKM